MTTDTKLILGTVVGSVAIIVGALFYFGNDKTPKRETLGTASVTVDKTSEDFGSMKNDEERSAVFTITNTSQSSVLRIWGISTSCDCTFATIKIGEQTTGEFNMPMHMQGNLKNWIG